MMQYFSPLDLGMLGSLGLRMSFALFLFISSFVALCVIARRPPPFVNVTPEDFEEIGLQTMFGRNVLDNRTRRFKRFFGTEPKFVSLVWMQLHQSGWFGRSVASPQEPKHLLMALYFLQQYEPEVTGAVMFGVDENEFQIWAWLYASGIASLADRMVCHVDGVMVLACCSLCR
jgi:hypothetical protein